MKCPESVDAELFARAERLKHKRDDWGPNNADMQESRDRAYEDRWALLEIIAELEAELAERDSDRELAFAAGREAQLDDMIEEGWREPRS